MCLEKRSFVTHPDCRSLHLFLNVVALPTKLGLMLLPGLGSGQQRQTVKLGFAFGRARHDALDVVRWNWKMKRLRFFALYRNSFERAETNFVLLRDLAYRKKSGIDFFRFFSQKRFR